jgi:tRNA-specific adenosine deaminase 3
MKELEIEDKIKQFLLSINVSEYKIQKNLIPITQPITQEQYNICKTMWTVNFQPTYYSNMIYKHKESEQDEIFKIVKEMKDINYDCLVYDPHMKEIVLSQKYKKSFNPISHSLMNLIQTYSLGLLNELGKTHSTNEDLKFTEQYFMENMYVFTTNEPCPMCSMALTHSRIKRLYYLNKSGNGSIESKLKLCNYENLNHSYTCFRIDILKD